MHKNGSTGIFNMNSSLKKKKPTPLLLFFCLSCQVKPKCKHPRFLRWKDNSAVSGVCARRETLARNLISHAIHTECAILSFFPRGLYAFFALTNSIKHSPGSPPLVFFKIGTSSWVQVFLLREWKMSTAGKQSFSTWLTASQSDGLFSVNSTIFITSRTFVQWITKWTTHDWRSNRLRCRRASSLVCLSAEVVRAVWGFQGNRVGGCLDEWVPVTTTSQVSSN